MIPRRKSHGFKRFRTSTHIRSHRTFPWKPVLWIAAVCIATIVAAVLIGNDLRRKTDETRARREANVWTLSTEEQTVAEAYAYIPDFRGTTVSPNGTLSGLPTLEQGNGIIIDVTVGDGNTFAYALPMASSVGLTVPVDAPSLVSEIQRLHIAGLRVCGVCRIRCLDTAFAADPVLSAYRRGVELSILTACASAGLDEILLIGLPAGSETDDGLSVAYLNELHTLLMAADHTPLVGVSLTPVHFARTEETTSGDITVLYGGTLTPSRMQSACDFLALDVRDVPTDLMDGFLSDIRYIYARYGLRLLYTAGDTVTATIADTHGFTRIMGVTVAETDEQTLN